MYDKELILEVLEQIRTASQTILGRFKPVKTVSDFTDSPAGMEKLDSICMMLIAIGETLKKRNRSRNFSLPDPKGVITIIAAGVTRGKRKHNI